MAGKRGTQEIQNFKKRQAIALHQKGWKCAEIAEAVDVTTRAVQRWLKEFSERGEESLEMKRRGIPEEQTRLVCEADELELKSVMVHYTPEELGLPYLLWNRQAVQELVLNKFGVRLAARTVGTYLQRWGYTAQRPAKKAYEQDDVAAREWVEKEYPAIEKRAMKEKAVILWGDESRCQNQPGYQRGYAPAGKTPTLLVSGKKKLAINFISAVGNRGDMRFMLYEGTMDAPRFIDFLRRIIGSYPDRKVFLIVDNLRVHKSRKVKAWLKTRTERIELFYLPPYSPELNPDEYLNQDMKRNVHRKGMPRTQQQLAHNARAFLKSIQRRPDHVSSYFRHRFVRYAA